MAGFHVDADLPVRVRFFRDADSAESEILVVVHHIACDGESVRVLLQDLVTAYAARRRRRALIEPLPVQYADFALWQREILGGTNDPRGSGRPAGLLARHLASLPAVADLPMDRPRPAVADAGAGVVRLTVRADIAAPVAPCAAHHRVTPFIVFHRSRADRHG